MAAPQFVPIEPQQEVRSYESPPWRPEPWFPDRPAEIEGRQPLGERFGVPGPDQGYALLLAERYEGRVRLQEGEEEADALAGATAIATKRAGLFARGPVLHDITVGLTIWGFLDVAPDPELVDLRREWFEGVHIPVHYPQRRRIVDAAPVEVLRLPHRRIAELYDTDWRRCLDLDVAETLVV